MERVGETGSQEEAGGRAALHSPPSALPRGRQVTALWTGGAGGGGLSSPSSGPSGLWGLLTVPELAPLPSVLCRWQLKISSARRRYLVIFSFTASRLSLLGSTVGSRALPGSTPVLGGGWGFGLPWSALCLPREGVPISAAGQGLLTPRLFLGPPLGGKRAGEAGKGRWLERLEPGPSLCLHPFQLASTPRWPPSHPGKGQRGDFHVCFPEEEKESPREHMPSSISDAPCERGQNGGQDWRAKEFTGRA